MGFYFRFFLDDETSSVRQVAAVLFARIANPSYRDEVAAWETRFLHLGETNIGKRFCNELNS